MIRNDLTKLERLTLDVLFANALDGVAVIRATDIAAKVNVSARSVRTALANLHRLGVIDRQLSPGPWPSRYVLLQSKCQ